jgi:AraC family transcriptional regulator of adaptative response/methylated-DNA-[protein]-cysteine methyltransferase
MGDDTMPTTLATDDPRWSAILRRDAQADGRFVYAVRTTGVFCRPSCPSRQPRRENVLCFATCDDAQRAGYRACRRCVPTAAPGESPAARAIVRACRLIEESGAMPGLDQLARAAGLSPTHFHRVFKRTVGVTPRGYAEFVRTKRLHDTLKGEQTVFESIAAAGFGSIGRAYAGAGATLGMSPAQYKAGAPGLVVRYAVAHCSLGWLLVAATERGVCAIEFGDSADALREHVAEYFPGAERRDDEAAFASLVAAVVALVERPRHGPELPLDIQGTAFQRRVWEALRAIPCGSTASYAEIAEQIGRPSAARAVARACATNPIAVAIPCHRVVRQDGDLSGYRWGVERKQALLEREAQPEDRDGCLPGISHPSSRSSAPRTSEKAR